MAKPWGGIGAWAADSERAEAEELAEAAQAESQSFPSLKEAANTKPKKKKMTLSEFNMGGSFSASGPAASSRVGLTPEEMMRLPTGPKERSADEMQFGRLGGGFSSYGRSGSNPGRGRDRDDAEGSWGGGGRRSYGGFDDDRRGPPSRVSDFDQPSRADEVDNWALTKKSLPSSDSGRQNRYGSLGGGGGGGAGAGVGVGGPWSRADEVDNWAVGKKPAPARTSTFGSGFRDSGPEPDRWARGGREADGVERERPRLVLDPPKGELGVNESVQVVKTNKPSPFGAARPREEILAEKGLDWKKLDSEIDAKKTSRPTSAHSSRPSSSQSSRSEGPGLHGSENVVKPRPKVNPFGDAKPREVLLEERGKDWRKMDLELEHLSVDRLETEEERKLKEEIDHLKKELEKESPDKTNSETGQESGGDQASLRDIVLQKERELETLIHDLDDKVRFGQKAIDRPGSGAGRPGSGAGRPGSGAGRAGSFLDRTPSQSGSFEDSRSTEFIDRPHSHGIPIVPPGAVYCSNFSPANPAFDGCGSVRNFAIGSPFSTGVLAAESVSLLYGGSGGMGRSTSALGPLELQNEKLDNTKCEEPAISRAVSQRDMGTQITPNGCLHHSPPPPKRRSSFAPSSSTLLSIVEQQREHFAKLEVREVQVDNGATGTKGSRRGGSVMKRHPDVYDFDKIAIKNQPPSFNIAEAAMNSSRKQREEAKITAWENLQKAKAEAALRKLEMKLEKKRSSTMDKIMKKVRNAQVKAHKMRSSIAVKDGHQAPKTPGKLASFGKLVRGGSLSSCFTRNAA